MAVLEAFVYDPLINWRLMQHDTEARRGDQGQSSLLRCVTHCSCVC
jgi:phosphatidylinositol kinase/protein kinase (PI-3  family)